MATKIITAVVALLMGITFSTFAGDKDHKVNKETKEATAEKPTESTEETKDFYVDAAGNRIDIEYPTMGNCGASETENCHATYTRLDEFSPWVLQGSIQKGLKPF